MKEFDGRLKAKYAAEFITPQKLRQFISDKVSGNNLRVLEPAVGSGQLLFNLIDRINSVEGFDVNNDALVYAKENFGNKAILHNLDFITAEIKEYDVAISNYPFSLKPTDEQQAYILADPFLSRFYNGKVTGVLDIVFILKSFNAVQEGYYLCFPGIGYRGSEKRFREWLISNKHIQEYGLIEECAFEHTSISILFLHLTKKPNERVNSFRLNLKTGYIVESSITLTDHLEIPYEEIEREVINPVELEETARKNVERVVMAQIKISRMIWEIDELIHERLPSVDEWKRELIGIIELS